jgi:hypothetical protein
VTIKAKPDGRGIRTADLQIFNIDTLTVIVFSSLALTAPEQPGGATQFTPITTEQEFWPANKAIEEACRSRRGSVTRAELEDVARIYREHFDGNPSQAVQLLLGYTERTAGRRIRRLVMLACCPKPALARGRRDGEHPQIAGRPLAGPILTGAGWEAALEDDTA